MHAPFAALQRFSDVFSAVPGGVLPGVWAAATTRDRGGLMVRRQRVPGRGLIATAVMSTALIQPVVDFSGSHVFNDDWPPHAHFHDLAAIGMMEICSATSMYLMWTERGDRALNMAIAAILPAAFWAPFFPSHFVSGSSLDDTTAHHKGPRMPKIGPFTLYPNATIAAIELLIIGAGWTTFRRNYCRA